jgi:hypothetical protein
MIPNPPNRELTWEGAASLKGGVAAGVGGVAAAIAPYIGAAVAVPHGGSYLLPWPL